MFTRRQKTFIVVVLLVAMNYLILSPLYAIDIKKDYISDGELMIKSVEELIESLIDEPAFDRVVVSSVENLGDTSNLEDTLLYDRIEDTFIKVLSENRMLSGTSSITIKTSDDEKEDVDDGKYENLTPEEKREIEEKMKKDEEDGNLLFGDGGEASSDSEDSSNEDDFDVQFTGSGDYIIQYRLLICKVDYENMKNWRKRRVATTKMYIRLYNTETDVIEWADEVYGYAEDIVPHEYVDKLKDSRYIQVRMEKEGDEGTNPLVEPLLVSGITAGLILLFSITAKSSD